MKTISVFCCLLYATWTTGASIIVEGFERGAVSFKCSHRLAKKNHKYLCKDPCKDSKDILVTVKSGGLVESGRITLEDFGDGFFNVTLRQLQLSDSGRYWCGVDRPGVDTYSAVHLTVKEAIAIEITTVTPKLSPTWTYQTVSNSTQLTPGANPFTASNCTNGGEQNISTGTVLYATVGVTVMLTTFLLATCCRKHASTCFRKSAKPQTQVCSNSTDHNTADDKEADCEYDDIGEEVQSIEILSERFSCTHHCKEDQPTSAFTAAECSASLHIYENICCSKSTADSRYSAANAQDKQNISSGIYIKPLPATISERTGDGSPG